MSSLRQRVSTYFRQLSFINPDPRTVAPIQTRPCDNGFVRRFLDGQLKEPEECPQVLSAREPQDMPDVQVRFCDAQGVTKAAALASTGPDQGITSVQRSKLHLSTTSDIDFIDNNNLESDFEVRRSKRANVPRFGGIVVGGSGESRLASRKSSTGAPNPAEQQPRTGEIRASLNAAPIDSRDGPECIAGVSDWTADSEFACGLSTSLYERNPVSGEVTGSPIADCFALIARHGACVLGLADGVNWGEKASLAARAALRGAVEYLETALFAGDGPASTRDIFVSLLRALWEGHACILEVGGSLTTLTLAVVVPLAGPASTDNVRRWAVCACNVGDSLGFVYSPASGVREFTQASHDTNTARDMRDALGALGPVDGTKPELSNLTFSMTEVGEGDLVFLTSDGVSDNFDPVVGRFALAASETPDLGAVKTRHAVNQQQLQQQQQPVKGLRAGLQQMTVNASKRPQYNRSRTVIEPNRRSPIGNQGRLRSTASSLPHVTAEQRQRLTLLRLEDLLSNGINGQRKPVESARRLCQLLIDFTVSITQARRNTLEQRETYVRLVTDPATGQRREAALNKIQQRAARKRLVDSATFQALPGKLDHASVVAFMCKGRTDNSAKVRPVGDGEPRRPRIAVIETDL